MELQRIIMSANKVYFLYNLSYSHLVQRKNKIGIYKTNPVGTKLWV
jgi:hypothetical protein